MADRGTVGARLDHVGLTVTDLKAAVSWFCDVFGLVPELTLRVEALDLSIEMLVHPAFGYRLELLHRPGSAAARKPANPGEAALREGYGHVAFDITDLDGAFDRASRSRRAGRGGARVRPAVRPGTGPGDL
jgi:lactoylglutathione lyase